MDQITELVRERMSALDGSHDWSHVERVVRLAQHIAEYETNEVDKEMVHLAALLHDVSDSKYFPKDEANGEDLVTKWLQEFVGYPAEKIAKVHKIIHGVSFRNEMTDKQIVMFTELAIVQDADRLDALGAIGIARAFAYGGNKKSALWNQTGPSVLHHFDEKLLKLEGLMKTKRGREIARERHDRMIKFVKQFKAEWTEFEL